MKQEVKITDTTTRDKAIEWWGSNITINRNRLAQKYWNRNGIELQDNEIEAIYIAEHSTPTTASNVYDENDNVRDLDIPIHTPLTQDENLDWDLYPGNEAGAFDHLDNEQFNEDMAIKALEEDLYKQPTGAPPITNQTKKEDGAFICLNCKECYSYRPDICGFCQHTSFAPTHPSNVKKEDGDILEDENDPFKFITIQQVDLDAYKLNSKVFNKLLEESPKLAAENTLLKEQVRVLREALQEFIYNWDAMGNANDYSHTALKAKEALNHIN